MRKKQLVISISLVMTVLFSILFQSLHTYAHFVKQFAEKECHHKKNNYGEPEITHQHHTVDDCKVCHFTFGSYITPKVITYNFHILMGLQKEIFFSRVVCMHTEAHPLLLFNKLLILLRSLRSDLTS
jgi:hypothetical protein